MLINLVNHDLVVDNEVLTNFFAIDISSIVVFCFNLIYFYFFFLITLNQKPTFLKLVSRINKLISMGSTLTCRYAS